MALGAKPIFDSRLSPSPSKGRFYVRRIGPKPSFKFGINHDCRRAVLPAALRKPHLHLLLKRLSGALLLAASVTIANHDRVAITSDLGPQSFVTVEEEACIVVR